MRIDTRAAGPERPTSKWAMTAVIALVVMVGGYFALGMPGMDHGTASSTVHDMSVMSPTGSTFSELSADQFNMALADETTYVINVHVPYEGEIDDTDALIAFDEIAESTDLPSDLDQPILLYCQTGRMSKIAATTLIRMGYTDVGHLVGGMRAWLQPGRMTFDDA